MISQFTFAIDGKFRLDTTCLNFDPFPIIHDFSYAGGF